MVDKGGLSVDPRGLIYEAYRIDGITEKECRSIFLDWALGAGLAGEAARAALRQLLEAYGAPEHPMTRVLEEGLAKVAQSPARRGGAMGRRRGR
ncbi:MAG: hypothetical protein AAF761_10265 [Pseudomonadota bacterium]